MTKLVMIVDDSPTVRKIVEVTLQRVGYEVVAVPDGVEAVALALTQMLPFSSPAPSRKRARNGADWDARDHEATDRLL